MATPYRSLGINVFVDLDAYRAPYLPDLNPIEMAFSKSKAHLRCIGAGAFDQMFKALAETGDPFSQRECWNYFCEAEYGSGLKLDALEFWER